MSRYSILSKNASVSIAACIGSTFKDSRSRSRSVYVKPHFSIQIWNRVASHVVSGCRSWFKTTKLFKTWKGKLTGLRQIINWIETENGSVLSHWLKNNVPTPPPRRKAYTLFGFGFHIELDSNEHMAASSFHGGGRI